jgi:hypothetical protein
MIVDFHWAGIKKIDESTVFCFPGKIPDLLLKRFNMIQTSCFDEITK